jgi:RNA polymerase sigma-70 factor (ECF subfamily)
MTDPPRSPEIANVEGSTPEFREIFSREFSYVWHTLRRLGVREADRLDLTQEVFVTVHGALADYDPARPLRPWLFGIAYRIALRYRALVRHEREVLSDEIQAVDQGLAVDETLARKEREELVAAAIAKIDLVRRAVFIMCEIDGIPMPEVAHAFGISVNTGYSRLRAAREDFEAAARRLMKARPA